MFNTGWKGLLVRLPAASGVTAPSSGGQEEENVPSAGGKKIVGLTGECVCVGGIFHLENALCV